MLRRLVYLIKQQQKEIHQPQLMVKNIKDCLKKKANKKCTDMNLM